jgi:hypothetical protein
MLPGKTLGAKIFVERSLLRVLVLSMTVVSMTSKGDPVKPVQRAVARGEKCWGD